MGRTISQAPTTADLCNCVLDRVNHIYETTIELARGSPTTESLRLLSAMMGWCADARSLILEIKSQV